MEEIYTVIAVNITSPNNYSTNMYVGAALKCKSKGLDVNRTFDMFKLNAILFPLRLVLVPLVLYSVNDIAE